MKPLFVRLLSRLPLPTALLALAFLTACMEATTEAPVQRDSSAAPNISGVYQPLPDCKFSKLPDWRKSQTETNACLADMLTLTKKGNGYSGEYQFFNYDIGNDEVWLHYFGEFSLTNLKFSDSTVTAKISGRGATIGRHLNGYKNPLKGTVKITIEQGIPQIMTWHIPDTRQDGAYSAKNGGGDIFETPIFFYSSPRHDLKVKLAKNEQYFWPSITALNRKGDDLRRQRQQQSAAVIAGIAIGAAAGAERARRGLPPPNTSSVTGANSTRQTQAAVTSTPSSIEAPNSNKPFVRDNLRNFTVSSESIEVCIWDHECEDGDRVSVTASSDAKRVTLFSNHRLSNGRQCRTLNLRDMHHDPNALDLSTDGSRGQPKALRAGQSVTITLRADNGTGFEGQCSHTDVNTGAVQVSGGGGNDTWSLRSGTGSSGRITYSP